MLNDSLMELFKDLNSHIFIYSVSLTQFWNTNRLCVPLDEFQQFMKSIEFYHYDMRKLIQDDIQFITLENVLEGVEQWKKAETSIGQFLANKSPTKKQRNLENNSSILSKPGYMTISSKLHQPKKNYLKEHLRKEKEQNFKLDKTMEKAKNESDYQVTMKVGEVNDICKKLKNGVQYMIDTKDKKIQIIESTKDANETIIPLKKFYRKYEAFKQSSINQAEEVEGTLEDDLRKVFVQAMVLSTELQSQIKLLQSKGISY